MLVIPNSKLPKADYCPAAEIRMSFDEIAQCLKVKPFKGAFRDGLPFPNRYKGICLLLSTGRGATLMQTEMRQAVVEIGLEIREDEFFHEEDLLEVMEALRIDKAYVKRFQNDFIWMPAVTKG
jgi:hypothetical protein